MHLCLLPIEPCTPLRSHDDASVNEETRERWFGALQLIVGLGLMIAAQALEFQQEQEEREAEQRQEMIDDVSRRVGESLRELRSKRPPLRFDDLWDRAPPSSESVTSSPRQAPSSPPEERGE